MSVSIERKEEQKIWFSAEQRKQLFELFDMVEKALKETTINLNNEYSKIDIDKAYNRERDINEKRDKIRKSHFQNIEKAEYGFQNGMIYNDMFSSLEKIGDHVINVNEAISGKI